MKPVPNFKAARLPLASQGLWIIRLISFLWSLDIAADLFLGDHDGGSRSSPTR